MITDSEFKKLQKLAKLNISESEKERFLSKLKNIMDMIDELRNIDCSGIKPLRSVCDANQRLRADKITETDNSSKLFNNIPEREASLAKEIKCFIVPKVIE